MARPERWASGDAYEPFIGRWSRLVAERFVDVLDPVPGRRWLDVGCGTGAVARLILDEAEPEAVRGVDPSDAFVTHARRSVQDPRVEFLVGDARSIEEPDASFDYVVSGLVVNFLPDPDAAVAEMKRVARPGGQVACYVWDYAAGMQMLRSFWDAAREVDPGAVDLDEGVRFELCQPGPLGQLWRDGGLVDVSVRSIEVPTVFSDFDDYWQPFLGGQGPAPTYIVSLDEQVRRRIEQLLRERLPQDDEGRISMTARAWTVVGRVV